MFALFEASFLVVDLETLDRERKHDTRRRWILCDLDPARDITRQYDVIVPETSEQACPEDQHTDLTLALYHFENARFGIFGRERRICEYGTNEYDGSEKSRCTARL